jgi:hypothetical protein
LSHAGRRDHVSTGPAGSVAALASFSAKARPRVSTAGSFSNPFPGGASTPTTPVLRKFGQLGRPPMFAPRPRPLRTFPGSLMPSDLGGPEQVHNFSVVSHRVRQSPTAPSSRFRPWPGQIPVKNLSPPRQGKVMILGADSPVPIPVVTPTFVQLGFCAILRSCSARSTAPIRGIAQNPRLCSE